MTKALFDKSKLTSRHVSVGPERAPHRSYYYAMGLDEEMIGRPIETFAYPNGAVDAPTAAEIENAGYRGAVSTIQGNWQTSGLRYWLRRYPANPWEAPPEILTRIRTTPR